MKRFYRFLHTPGAPERGRVGYWAWNLFWMLFGSCLIAALCMLVSYGDYPYQLFTGYFQNPLLLVMNALPLVWLFFFLFLAVNRGWIAFLITCLAGFLPAAANYFKLLFRDETLVFSDLLYLKEGLNISDRYAVRMDWKLWLMAACAVVGTVCFFLLVRGRLRKKAPRLILLGVVLASLIPLTLVYRSSSIYYYATENPAFNTTWKTTEYTASKGFWYSFLYSASDMSKKQPEGYDQDAVEALLDEYPAADIPDDQKVDILAIQLEAFTDLTAKGVTGVSDAAYAYYHTLEQESYTGRLVTSTFAAGTILTERSFLTGLYYIETIRRNTDSYVWYLRDQGYRTEFSHGSNDWFYNRANIREYLGFENGYFLENYFGAINDGQIAYDDVYLPAVLDLYDQAKAAGDAPYFGFHVTYQGHGPYSSEFLNYGDGWYTGDLPQESQNILNNYLGSVANTQQNLEDLVDSLRQRETPVVLVLYGDHMPWLGDGNSVYEQLGVNLDLETETGFYNYYATQYLIWANDAARDLLGDSFTGTGPDVSPMYLMGLVFDRCGWTGPSLMQLDRDWQQTLPVISSAGYTVEAGVGVTYGQLSDTAQQVLGDCYDVTYYKRNKDTMR